MSFSFNVEADADDLESAVSDALHSYIENTPDLGDDDRKLLDVAVADVDADHIGQLIGEHARYRIECSGGVSSEGNHELTVRLLGIGAVADAAVAVEPNAGGTTAD